MLNGEEILIVIYGISDTINKHLKFKIIQRTRIPFRQGKDFLYYLLYDINKANLIGESLIKICAGYGGIFPSITKLEDFLKHKSNKEVIKQLISDKLAGF